MSREPRISCPTRRGSGVPRFHPTISHRFRTRAPTTSLLPCEHAGTHRRAPRPDRLVCSLKACSCKLPWCAGVRRQHPHGATVFRFPNGGDLSLYCKWLEKLGYEDVFGGQTGGRSSASASAETKAMFKAETGQQGGTIRVAAVHFCPADYTTSGARLALTEKGTGYNGDDSTKQIPDHRPWPSNPKQAAAGECAARRRGRSPSPGLSSPPPHPRAGGGAGSGAGRQSPVPGITPEQGSRRGEGRRC